jgi:hypothetical protein
VAELIARRYRPYFELWTIWGFFNPVAYREAEARGTLLRWADRGVTGWASAAYRRYDDTGTQTIFERMTDDAQRYGLGARYHRGDWSARGEYRFETGFGATLSSGDVELRWQAADRLALTATGSAFQQIEQFRIGENVVGGGSVGAEIGLPGGATLRGGAALYRQAYENRPSGADWNQARAWTMLTVPFGRDPGLAGGRP